jgi:hypothetical protein
MHHEAGPAPVVDMPGRIRRACSILVVALLMLYVIWDSLPNKHGELETELVSGGKGLGALSSKQPNGRQMPAIDRSTTGLWNVRRIVGQLEAGIQAGVASGIQTGVATVFGFGQPNPMVRTMEQGDEASSEHSILPAFMQTQPEPYMPQVQEAKANHQQLDQQLASTSSDQKKQGLPQKILKEHLPPHDLPSKVGSNTAIRMLNEEAIRQAEELWKGEKNTGNPSGRAETLQTAFDKASWSLAESILDAKPMIQRGKEVEEHNTKMFLSQEKRAHDLSAQYKALAATITTPARSRIHAHVQPTRTLNAGSPAVHKAGGGKMDSVAMHAINKVQKDDAQEANERRTLDEEMIRQAKELWKAENSRQKPRRGKSGNRTARRAHDFTEAKRVTHDAINKVHKDGAQLGANAGAQHRGQVNFIMGALDKFEHGNQMHKKERRAQQQDYVRGSRAKKMQLQVDDDAESVVRHHLTPGVSITSEDDNGVARHHMTPGVITTSEDDNGVARHHMTPGVSINEEDDNGVLKGVEAGQEASFEPGATSTSEGDDDVARHHMTPGVSINEEDDNGVLEGVEASQEHASERFTDDSALSTMHELGIKANGDDQHLDISGILHSDSDMPDPFEGKDGMGGASKVDPSEDGDHGVYGEMQRTQASMKGFKPSLPPSIANPNSGFGALPPNFAAGSSTSTIASPPAAFTREEEDKEAESNPLTAPDPLQGGISYANDEGMSEEQQEAEAKREQREEEAKKAEKEAKEKEAKEAEEKKEEKENRERKEEAREEEDEKEAQWKPTPSANIMDFGSETKGDGDGPDDGLGEIKEIMAHSSVPDPFAKYDGMGGTSKTSESLPDPFAKYDGMGGMSTTPQSEMTSVDDEMKRTQEGLKGFTPSLPPSLAHPKSTGIGGLSREARAAVATPHAMASTTQELQEAKAFLKKQVMPTSPVAVTSAVSQTSGFMAGAVKEGAFAEEHRMERKEALSAMFADTSVSGQQVRGSKRLSDRAAKARDIKRLADGVLYDMQAEQVLRRRQREQTESLAYSGSLLAKARH